MREEKSACGAPYEGYDCTKKEIRRCSNVS